LGDFDSAYDYLRIVRIKDDGSYDTLCETDYGEIPIFVVGMGKWIDEITRKPNK
jgi:hypothetical protein